MEDFKKELVEKIQQQLFELKDEKYKDFNSKLLPTVDPNLIIGIRTPILRKFAKDFAKTSESREYIKILPHKYMEENNVHGFIIETIKDYDEVISCLDEFLPYVDNWATCDIVSPKIFSKHLDKFIIKIQEWIKSDKTYTIRFGIEMLMSFYLNDAFKPEYLKLVSDVISEEYYVNMMKAWFFATALAKQYNSAIIYIEEKRLDNWSHNKTIQKAVESFRITDEQKKYLKSMKIK